ncbi:DUF4188 domain-containing protein [Meiothermus hypogaeus]|uniref:Transcriptional regulator n=2 Tax=Meiothermus hypogaeus TaxID=884155 RepID=A0A511R7C4_9DEIN|nr:DUF4188 domain-containing protein [Meiothermus hypogaeus]RIH74726.1 hypothetical protein Mhypo_03217 [Meiothermus hypogaeus]GEM84832.1 transcriptional regulator [Meiothermus hypogaeus NBRC 106114]
MIQIGRFTAQHEGPLVVFLIGVRINNWWRFREWLPVVQAMRPMIQYLYHHPESGFLGLGGQWLSMDFRGLLMVQYWRSSNDLERFARTDPELHPEAWRNFFRQSYKGGAVGIWHETYVVERQEAVYGNMPLMGLAKVSKAVPIRGKLETMRERLQKESV